MSIPVELMKMLFQLQFRLIQCCGVDDDVQLIELKLRTQHNILGLQLDTTQLLVIF